MSEPKFRPTLPQQRHYPKLGRNQPCPCGSLRKYKHCHWRDATFRRGMRETLEV